MQRSSVKQAVTETPVRLSSVIEGLMNREIRLTRCTWGCSTWYAHYRMRVASRAIEKNERRLKIDKLPMEPAARTVRAVRQAAARSLPPAARRARHISEVIGGAATSLRNRRNSNTMSTQDKNSGMSGQMNRGQSTYGASAQQSQSSNKGPVYAIVSGKNLPKSALQGAEQSAAGVGQDHQAAALARFSSREALNAAAEAEGFTIQSSIQLDESSGWEPFNTKTSSRSSSSNPNA